MTSPVRPPATGKRILLGQHLSNGDCLYATTIARQIKEDFPDCHLTWAIGAPCQGLLEGNPHVDAVWVVEFPDREPETVKRIWREFRAEAETRRARGEFDEMFFTQILPDNSHHFDGMIRSSIFHGYPRPITVPVSPVLRLTPGEIRRVDEFAARHGLAGQRQVILFECAPQSGQSAINPASALQLARQMVALLPEVRVILSSNVALPIDQPRIHDASTLTFRENAELTKHCALLIGCSSGITWISTSEAAKPLPMIQLVAEDSTWPNSVLRDFRRWGLPTDLVLEMADGDAPGIPHCVQAIFNEGFATARARYHRRFKRRFYVQAGFQQDLVSQGRIKEAWKSLCLNLREHGLHPAYLAAHGRLAARHLKRNFILRFGQLRPARLSGHGHPPSS